MIMFLCFFFFKQKTAYEMRISDWSSDVCSSDLAARGDRGRPEAAAACPDRYRRGRQRGRNQRRIPRVGDRDRAKPRTPHRSGVRKARLRRDEQPRDLVLTTLISCVGCPARTVGEALVIAERQHERLGGEEM